MLARIAMMILLSASATAMAGEPSARNDTTLEFSIEEQGKPQTVVVAGVVAEINDKNIPAKTTLTRDTTYVAARKTENGTITLVPNTVREGAEVQLTNTSSTRASVNMVLDMLRGIQAIGKGAGSVATTQRHQVAMEVKTGKQEQTIRMDDKDYKVTTVYTPGDSVLANTQQEEKSKQDPETKAKAVLDDDTKQTANPKQLKSTSQEKTKVSFGKAKRAQKKGDGGQTDGTDGHGHP